LGAHWLARDQAESDVENGKWPVGVAKPRVEGNSRRALGRLYDQHEGYISHHWRSGEATRSTGKEGQGLPQRTRQNSKGRVRSCDSPLTFPEGCSFFIIVVALVMYVSLVMLVTSLFCISTSWLVNSINFVREWPHRMPIIWVFLNGIPVSWILKNICFRTMVCKATGSPLARY
jgi:hypothetical protein